VVAIRKYIQNLTGAMSPFPPPATLDTLHALLTFCENHHCEHPAIQNVRRCIASLETKQLGDASAEWQQIYFGKEGFNDWWPEPVSGETATYAHAVFAALIERCCRLMQSLATGTAV
jgi:hypothetical protein